MQRAGWKRCGFVLAAAIALLPVAPAQARRVVYRFDGGTAKQRVEVARALSAGRFDWSVLPQVVTVHIRAGVLSEARPGEVWLDANLLDAGSFSWGVIQHEFAHQIDFLLLDDDERASMQRRLGGATWWPVPGRSHESAAAERFASTLAWAYWPSARNCMKPTSRSDESGSLPPATFRHLVDALLAAARGDTA